MAVPSDIELKKQFLNITDATLKQLEDVSGIVTENIEHILDIFYAHVAHQPHLLALFGKTKDEQHRGIARARAGQLKHWAQLFSGRLDEGYAASARHIGFTHSRVGLEPAWYIGSYVVLLNHLHDVVSRRFVSRLKPRAAQAKTMAALAAISQAVMLDMDIAISTYLETVRETRSTRLTQDFEASVKTTVDAISASIATLGAGADTLSGAISLTRDQAAASARSARDASADTQSVAAAAEQLAASSGEIARQIERANGIAHSAVEEAARANAVVSGLSDAARGIGQIVELIQSVAAQTRLLALNATIEAARAGEAGKGFAVVAGEVNGLAAQTGQATGDIARQIEAIRTASAQTAGVIDGIGATIGEISTIFDAIATAAREQLGTTDEITRAVQQAASKTAHIAVNMDDVISAADKAGQSGTQVEEISTELAAKSGNLDRKAAAFLSSLNGV